MSTREREKPASAKGLLTSLTAGGVAHEDQARVEQNDAVQDSPPAEAPLAPDGKAPLPPDKRPSSSSRKMPIAESFQEAPPTASTPSTAGGLVEGVEGVEGERYKPVYDWYKDKPLHYNCSMMGRCMAKLVPELYRHPYEGLVLVEEGRPRRIRSAKELSPLLIDNIHIRVWSEEGKRTERLSQAVINDMLNSRSFRDAFGLVQDIVTSPIVLPDGTPSEPGFNSGGILYLGPSVRVGNGFETIQKFQDVMDYDSNASRTNAIAAALTVLLRHYWYGGKPLVLLTANKSHSGKSTLCTFIAGGCAQAHMNYQNRDWPMEQSLQKQLVERPEIGVVIFDNVRLGSSGGGREIRSGLFESFITNSEFVLSSAKMSTTFRSLNKYVVLLNTNEGVMSADFLNRSLHIGLNSTGDLEERLARANAQLGGDVKTEWLPENLPRIHAELWGMIDRWVREGKPLDDQVKYPMAPWAKTIGGILMVNELSDFLGNYQAARSAVDPIREAIGYLAFYASEEAKNRGVKALPTRDLGKLVANKALDKVLLPGVNSSNLTACEREIGRSLTPYVGGTFTAPTATESISYKLHKKADRWVGKNVSCRYVFEEIKRTPAANQVGVVLEEQQAVTTGGGILLNTMLDDPSWEGDKL